MDAVVIQQVVGGVVTLAGSVVASNWWVRRATNKKLSSEAAAAAAEARHTDAESWVLLVDNLWKRQGELEVRLEKAEQRADACEERERSFMRNLDGLKQRVSGLEKGVGK